MEFPISGVEVSPLVPILIGFALATLATPVGVSGAFLLLPFQVSVLGFTAPGVTPTNLLFNVVSTPGGIAAYRRLGTVDWSLVRTITIGTIPGVIAGSILRVTVLADPGNFKAFAGGVLFVIGGNLIAQGFSRRVNATPTRESFSRLWVVLLGATAGLIGGIYGISGGSIIAPVLGGVFRLSLRRVAAAALISTLFTSVAGVSSFLLLDALASAPGPKARPDWLLAIFFGVGGAIGGAVGARLNVRMPEGALRFLLGVLAAVLGGLYVGPSF